MSRISREEWESLPPDERWAYVQALEMLAEGRDRLLAAIPPCPWHGEQCVSHAVEWVENVQRLFNPPLQGNSTALYNALDERIEKAWRRELYALLIRDNAVRGGGE